MGDHDVFKSRTRQGQGNREKMSILRRAAGRLLLSELHNSTDRELYTLTDNSSAEEEFARTIDLVKHYANLQFAELTVTIAITVGGIGFVFGGSAPHGLARILVVFGMAAVAACFWIIWESNSFQMWHFLKRAKELEPDLGYRCYSTMPGIDKPWIRPGTWAFRLLFIGLLAFWIAACFGLDFRSDTQIESWPFNARWM